MRPGIVHRLDKETSGLIVVAKTDASHRKLAANSLAGRSRRPTFALVHGWPKNYHRHHRREHHSRPRSPHPHDYPRDWSAREALSHYRVLRRLEPLTASSRCSEITVDTGRTHQIRVHLTSLGHPVVGEHPLRSSP